MGTQFSYTFDYLNIAIQDRIVLGTEIGATKTASNPLNVLLSENNLSDVIFFSNAIDTKTSGIDAVFSHKDIALGTGELDLNLSGNYTIETNVMVLLKTLHSLQM
tara:strand:- start:519 stop:833 length:315 start_codon:yes stop_codon:yes gene_type:complete